MSNWLKRFYLFKEGLCLLFVFIQLSFSVECFSQSYYYFDTSIARTDSQIVNYYVFLSLGLDGSATARVRYMENNTKTPRLVELSYADTSRNSTLDSSSSKFLSPLGNRNFLEGLEDESYLPFRIKFDQKTDSLEQYYIPSEIQFLRDGENWSQAETKINIEYSFEELLSQKSFLRYFYQETDPFYQYLVQSNSRGFSTGLSTSQLKSTMYLIAVANTLDKSIGASSKKDLEKVSSTFSVLAKKMGIPFVSKSISGENFNIHQVERAIKSLRLGKQDIVIFYYSGHGFRYEDDASKYPRMSLRTNRIQILEKNNLVVEKVYKKLLKKRANVTIVITDCCNEKIDSPVPLGLDILRSRSIGTEGLKLNFKNCQKLFFPPKPVSILASSAEIGQLAAGNPALGGFFTNFFNAELVGSLYNASETASWVRLLSSARRKTSRQALTALCGTGRCIQRAELMVTPPF